MLHSPISSSAASKCIIKLKPKGQMIRLASSWRPAHQNPAAILDSEQNKWTVLPPPDESSRIRRLLKCERKNSDFNKNDEFKKLKSFFYVITLSIQILSSPSSSVFWCLHLHLPKLFLLYSASSRSNSRALLPVKECLKLMKNCDL